MMTDDRELTLAAARGVGIPVFEVLANHLKTDCFSGSLIYYRVGLPGQDSFYEFVCFEKGIVVHKHVWQIDWQCAGVLIDRLTEIKKTNHYNAHFVDMQFRQIGDVWTFTVQLDDKIGQGAHRKLPRAVFKACAKLEGGMTLKTAYYTYLAEIRIVG